MEGVYFTRASFQRELTAGSSVLSLCSGPPGTWTDRHTRDWPLLPPCPHGTFCSLRNIQADVSCGKYSIGQLSVIWVSGRSIKGLRLDADGGPRRHIVLLRIGG